jgi:hypothetical protein
LLRAKASFRRFFNAFALSSIQFDVCAKYHSENLMLPNN